ncbi:MULTISPECIES: membrane or secreted protein [unclassified Flavobacterium]|jgi:hypothetical protein|uniref:membrane or secreted protein n=1 Tax=unclassified Flavobacterium TaxID=196869 RepID=UPI0025B9A6C8|nr:MULTISPECIES: membrane or secreted protein [unclassified Flavobacterium]
MKTVQKIVLLIALVAVLASCQNGTDVNKILSNQDTKRAIMDTIANDSNLSAETIGAMMNNENGKMMMMGNGNRNTMMMQNNPALMQSMMTGMMETFKGDPAMMSSMSSVIMRNQQMMDMIYKSRDGNRGMNNMNGMNNNTK